jgi:hypothetical protein
VLLYGFAPEDAELHPSLAKPLNIGLPIVLQESIFAQYAGAWATAFCLWLGAAIVCPKRNASPDSLSWQWLML